MENAPDPDEPLTLEEACRLIFKDAIKPATLRAEADRGRLELERIGRRLFVTRRAIQAMREKCRVVGNGSPPPAARKATVPDLAERARYEKEVVTALARRLRQAKTPKRRTDTDG